MLDGLEVVPRRELAYRGATFTEMDVDAVLARRPAVALVDELAHTNVPGSRNEKRWQDVEELLAAGIDVITTVNIQHLESLNDVVEKITGVPQRETVPDAVVRAADQVELVDMAPEALRRRMAHGNVYAPEKVDAALAQLLPGRQPDRAARAGAALDRRPGRRGPAAATARSTTSTGTWETRERVVVALTGGPEGETLIRRAARIAARSAGGDLLAVHVARSDGLTGAEPGALAAQRLLVETLGGTYHQVVGDDVPDALLDFARAENATQLVLGGSRRLAAGARCSPARASAPTRSATPATSTSTSSPTRRSGRGAACPGGRGSLTPAAHGCSGFALAVLLPPLLTVVLVPDRDEPQPGQRRAAVPAARRSWSRSSAGSGRPCSPRSLGSLLLNYYFTPPLHTFTIRRDQQRPRPGGLRPGRRAGQLGGRPGRPPHPAGRPGEPPSPRRWAPWPAASCAARRPAGAARAGPRGVRPHLRRPCSNEDREPMGTPWPAHGDGRRAARPGRGTPTRGARRRRPHPRAARPTRSRPRTSALVGAFAAQAAVVLDRHRLSRGRGRGGCPSPRPTACAPRCSPPSATTCAPRWRRRRRPCRRACAATTSTGPPRTATSCWQPPTSRSTGLPRLVDNLLDMSRLQAGALSVVTRPVAPRRGRGSALDDLGPAGRRSWSTSPTTCPLVQADPGLLERVVANLVANALRYSPADAPPLLSPAAASATASSCGSSTAARASRRASATGSSRRSSASATPTTPPASVSAWPCRAGLTEAMGGTLDARGDPGRRAHHGRLAAGAPSDLATTEPRTRRRAGRRVHPREPASWSSTTSRRSCGRWPSTCGRGTTRCSRAATGGERSPPGRVAPPDLVILDLGLPDIDGVDVIAGPRGWTDVPIVVLSGRTDSADKVDALDAGADDYVTKPFGMDELLARMRAVARRATPADDQAVGDVRRRHVDLAARRVTRRDGSRRAPHADRVAPARGAAAPPRQAAEPARSCSPRCGAPATTRPAATCGVYMAQLRRKLEADPARPRHLLTEPGMGYRFEP